ncbi:MAG: hypothetical protein L0229_20470 [Blastocatellia bacterium]|nr:hypothetical protein [Blastocatellia bacterium]
MQDAMFIYCQIKRHEIIVPNSCMYGWEADMISVTPAGLVSEYEIKVSRSDFFADAKKFRARRLANPLPIHTRPNYFYYAVPAGLVVADEIPDYAGLIYVHRKVVGYDLYRFGAEEIRRPSRLHGEKINERQVGQLMRALTHRYWNQRLRSK